MPGQIFNIQDDGTLIEMNQKPFDNEDIFQSLLERYPNLLAGDQIDTRSPRRWLLVKREMDVPERENAGGRWSIDHLFLDQDGIPTLVEVKRSTDTRLRREVVGQMLDYAANAVLYWSIEEMQLQFTRQCDTEQVSSDDRLADFLGDDFPPEDFWQTVKTNLQAGRVRLLFVADDIPAELRRIIEFLNTQMDPAEVLGVEIRHFVGQGLKTLVPRVLGQTAEAETRKSSGSTAQERANAILETADSHGVREILDAVFPKLRPSFSAMGYTKSAVVLHCKHPEFKSGAVVITLVPSRSSRANGLWTRIYHHRLAACFPLSAEELRASLPADGHFQETDEGLDKNLQGFITTPHSLDRFIALLRERGGTTP